MKSYRFSTSASSNVTFGVITASIAFVMELTLIPLVLSAMKSDLNLNVGQLAWIFNAYAISVALAVLSSGFIGDHVNKNRLFALGVILFTLGSLMSAASQGLESLVVARVVQGFGGGLFSPLVPILLTQSNAERSGKILMIWGGLVGIVAAALPIAGNAIMVPFGWRTVFLSFAGVSLLSLMLFAHSKPHIEPSLDQGAIDYRKLASLPKYWLLLVYIFLVYGCFTFFLFQFPIALHLGGETNTTVSTHLTCLWLTFALLSFLLRDKMDGQGLKFSLLIAPALLALSFANGVFSHDTFLAQMFCAVVAGAGLACCNSPSTHLLLRLAPKEMRAFSSSLDITFARCGGVVTVTLFSVTGSDVSAIAMIVLSALAILICSIVLRDDNE